jgi:hypothetical protein
MSDVEMNGQSEYLNRATKLRETATDVSDPRLREALVSSAESYERMAASLAEPDRSCTSNACLRKSAILDFIVAVCGVAAI